MKNNDRRGFMTKLLGGAVAASGTMWLPPALRAKVEEEGVKNLTLDELNEAFQALSKRVSDLEERISKLEDEEDPEMEAWQYLCGTRQPRRTIGFPEGTQHWSGAI